MSTAWWKNEEWADSLQQHVDLIRKFVRGDLSAPEFEEYYIRLFPNDNVMYPDVVFRPIDRLFSDVDAYVADPDLRDSEEDLDDEQLRACAAQALHKLTGDDR